MIKGELISFDRVKGYGFVAPESGGDDVFIHVNDLYGDKNLLSPGAIVEFRPEHGVRGLKASEVTVVRPAAPTPTPTPTPSTVTATPTSTATATSIRRVVLAAAPTASVAAPTAATSATTPTTPEPVPATAAITGDTADTVADTATATSTIAPTVDFEHEITEALLRVEPELTSRQILDIRKRLVRIARAHERGETAA
jgi:cold shock protein